MSCFQRLFFLVCKSHSTSKAFRVQRWSRYLSSLPNERRIFSIKEFWKFHASLQNTSIVINTTDPSQYNENKFIVESDNSLNISNISVQEDTHNKTVILQCHGDEQQRSIRISLPFLVDISVSILGSGNIEIGNTENNKIALTTEAGHVLVGGVKSNLIKVQTKDGNITCKKAVRGNVDFSSESGHIETERIQGSSLSFYSENGNIMTGDLYSEELNVKTNQGHARMRSIHGECEIESETGDVTVGTAEGRINVMSDGGNIHLYLTDKMKHADLSSNTGSVSLLLASDLGAQLDVETQMVDDSEAKQLLQETKQHMSGPCTRYLAQVNEGGPRIRVKAPSGKVVLKSSSWTEAVNIFNKSKDLWQTKC